MEFCLFDNGTSLKWSVAIRMYGTKERVRLPQGWVGIPTWPPLCRSFLRDVTAAILGYKTIKRRPWCYVEKLLWALIYVPV